jgi:hypothetical protein
MAVERGRLQPPLVTIAAARQLGDPRARPNMAWLTALLHGRVREIRSVLAELGSLERIHSGVRRRHEDGGRRGYAQFRAPFELYAMIRLLRPAHVVETGVSSGVSSTYSLLALRHNRRGTLHSIDRPLRQRGERFDPGESPVVLPPGRESGWVVPDRLRPRWDLRLGPSERLLPELVAELPSIGLFLHDSQHTPSHLRFELATVRPKLLPGAIVLADNTVWTGQAFPRFAHELGTPFYRRGHGDLVGLAVP